ncbi:MAG: hypothetical protein NTX92_06405, partial [Euryarchaeota archaeon]|nr:hypothetical protein [Euryarchaeota archaeon]
FQSVHGSYALVILSLSTAILIIFKVRKKLFYTIYVLSWLPFFITVFSPTVTLWVEKGFPTISLEVNQPNLFLVITTVIFLSITLLFSIHTFQKEVKKK